MDKRTDCCNLQTMRNIIAAADFSWSTFVTAIAANGIVLAWFNWFISVRTRHQDLQRDRLEALYLKLRAIHDDLGYKFLLIYRLFNKEKGSENEKPPSVITSLENLTYADMCVSLYLHPLKSEW